MNVILSRDGSFQPRGAVVSEDFSEAVQIAREQAADDGEEEVCVIGGAEIFALALPKARRMYLTEVAAIAGGDVVFPPSSTRGRGPRCAARPTRPDRSMSSHSSFGCWSGGA